MSAFETSQSIRTMLLIRAAEVFNYTSWNDEFAATHVKEFPDYIKACEWYKDVDVYELTLEQMISLGFGLYDDSGLRLIPLYLYPFLPEDIVTKCIDGETVIGKSNMDNDHRYGCLAYGIYPTK